MPPSLHVLSRLLAVLLVLGAPAAQALMRTQPEQQPSGARAAAVAPALVATPARIRLDEPSPGEVRPPGGDAAAGRAQIGFARAVPALRTAGELVRQLA